MKKVFITGGSGTVGEAFIQKYQTEYEFYSFSRNEKMQVALKRKYPQINIILGAVRINLQCIRAYRRLCQI